MKPRPIQARTRHQTIVLYGESGAGKTSLAATAPKPLFADSNKGLLSIAERPGLEHVRAVDVNGMGDLDAIYANATGTGKENWSKTYETLIFDHFDDIQGIVLDQLVERAMEKDERRDDEITQREYGIMGNKLRRYIRKFKRVPMHKILICGMKDDFETGEKGPSLVGALKSQLKYFVDHTLYLRMGKGGKRYIHLDPKPDVWYAKTRAHWLPPEARKIAVDFSDPEQMAHIFGLLAARPSSSESSRGVSRRPAR